MERLHHLDAYPVWEDPVVSESGEPSQPPVAVPKGDRFMGTAALAIEAAMIIILIAGLITALAFDVTEVEEWKVRAKLMSLSGQGLYGFTGIGGGVLIAVAVLVALGLARSSNSSGSGGGALAARVGAIAVGISLWLGLLIAVGVYVDLTEIDQADLAIATALSDLATLVMVFVAGWWGLTMASGSKR